MKGDGPHRLIIPEYLLAFLFCGAVVGETVSLSLAITALGPEIVGKLYLVNALVLLVLPLFFFKFIDRIDRGILLANLLLISVLLLTAILVLLQLFSFQIRVLNSIIVVLYPVAYLSKTVLFLTFWTLLSDIYTIQEAKRRFPIIAAWGFGGALCGAVIARLLIVIVVTQTVIMLWVIVYLTAWVYTKKINSTLVSRIKPIEDIPKIDKTLFGIGDLLTINLIRILTLFYFGVFITIFLIDYLFWKKCYIWFKTSEAVASFQFSFYLIHASITILLLRYVLPRVISKIGFTRIMYGLPIVFIIGGGILYLAYSQNGGEMTIYLFTTVQFFRYVLFEITFVPSYQMCFAAIVKERRGRAKTFLEGIVKPGAIFTTGLLLVVIDNYVEGLLIVIVLTGVVIFIIIYLLRRVYIKTVMHEPVVPQGMGELLVEAGLQEDHQLYTIVRRCSDAKESDIRAVAIHLLKKLGTPHALEVLTDIYEKERDMRMKELIARSTSNFYSYKARPFIEQLLNEQKKRIRANAIYAINQMHCNWKRHLKPSIAPLIFVNNRRVQLEAARYLWDYGTIHERNTVLHYLQSLLDSKDMNQRSAGLYLIGSIKSPGWEDVLLKNLRTASFQVFSKSIEVIFRHASEEVKLTSLKITDSLSRKHISIVGREIEREGIHLWNTLMTFSPHVCSRRMMFEIITCLRKTADKLRIRNIPAKLTNEAVTIIHQWIITELEMIYSDAFEFYCTKEKSYLNGLRDILEYVLREEQTHICGWVLSAMVLLDTKGVVVWRHIDIDIHEREQRNELVEVFESSSHDKIGSLVLPILKQDSWDSLAKVGKANFHFKNDGENEIEYFLKSDNHIIALSALYFIEQQFELYYRDERIKETLTMMVHDNNERISSAAMDLLRRDEEDKKKRSRAFELLDGVLFFKQTSLFHNISADKLLRLVEIAHLVDYQQNEIISLQGKISDQIYIVKTGCMHIEKDIDGISTLVTVVKRGETYGEIGLFSKTTRTTTARAQERSEIFIIKRSDLKRLVRETPDIAFNLLEVISNRLIKSEEATESLRKKTTKNCTMDK